MIFLFDQSRSESSLRQGVVFEEPIERLRLSPWFLRLLGVVILSRTIHQFFQGLLVTDLLIQSEYKLHALIESNLEPIEVNELLFNVHLFELREVVQLNFSID